MNRRTFFLTTLAATALPRLARSWEDEPADLKQLAAEAARQALAEAQGYRFTPDDGDAFEFAAKPLLNWSNTYRAPCYGSVFVWMSAGRPAVIASIYRFPTLGRTINAEFHSLHDQPFRLDREGKIIWQPTAAGVTFAPLPDAAPPAATLTRRLSQMRQMVRRFAGTLVTVTKQTHPLRLMPQPLLRYGGGKSGVVDGAIFALARETDPDILILLEARDAWQFALARMHVGELSIKLADREIWRVDEMKHPYIRKQGVYTLLQDLPLSDAISQRQASATEDRQP